MYVKSFISFFSLNSRCFHKNNTISDMIAMYHLERKYRWRHKHAQSHAYLLKYLSVTESMRNVLSKGSFLNFVNNGNKHTGFNDKDFIAN